MNIFKLKYAGLLFILSFMLSCNEEFDPRVVKEAVLDELYIKNGGLNGVITYEGDIDQKNKTIVFENVAAETNLLNVKFSGMISLGATLEHETYDFWNNRTQIVRIINGNIVTEYTVTVEINEPKVDPILQRVVALLDNGVTESVGVIDETAKTLSIDAKNKDFIYIKSAVGLPAQTDITFTTKDESNRIYKENPGKVKLDFLGRTAEYDVVFTYIPPTGVDLTQGNIYDYSLNPAGSIPITPVGAGVCRSTDFDGRNVVMAGRNDFFRFSLADIISGTATAHSMGQDDGYFALNGAAAAHGHYYSANMTTMSVGGYVTIRHWASESATPVIVCSVNDVTETVRYGDNMSIHLNESGDGYIFLIRYDGVKAMRLKVTNFETVVLDGYLTFPAAIAGGGFFDINHVTSWDQGAAVLNEYTTMSIDNTLYLTDMNGSLIYSVPKAKLPPFTGAVRIINFNKARYLLALTETTNSALVMYDISEGNTTKAALEVFATGTQKEVLNYSLGAYSGYGSAISTALVNDKLYIYASIADGGFAIFEYPPKLED